MNARHFGKSSGQRGVGLVEIMISVVIGMLLVLVIFQIYQVSEGQKRTITSGSDAAQNASYAMFLLSRDVSIAGNGIASSAVALDLCTVLSPFTAAQLPGGLRAIPVIIKAGATGNDPDQITVFLGGSGTLSTAVGFRSNSATTRSLPGVERRRIQPERRDRRSLGRPVHAVDDQRRRGQRQRPMRRARVHGNDQHDHSHSDPREPRGHVYQRRRHGAGQSGSGGLR